MPLKYTVGFISVADGKRALLSLFGNRPYPWKYQNEKHDFEQVTIQIVTTQFNTNRWAEMKGGGLPQIIKEIMVL